MKALLTVDLGYGDAGKGSIIDFMARDFKSKLVVRYNGGCQAAHNVVTPEGVHHTFSQFGSGTLAGAETFLSRFVVVSPDNFVSEAEHLQEIGADPRSVYIDRSAPISTPFHRMANRIRELNRGEGKHGSCGQGIGEVRAEESMGLALTVDDVIGDNFVEYLRNIARRMADRFEMEKGHFTSAEAEKCLEFLLDPPMDKIISQYMKFETYVKVVDSDWLSQNMAEMTLFEGAQGVLLDPRYGVFPHVTYGNTTLDNAYILLGEMNFPGATHRIGITRAYATRHGAGPLKTESNDMMFSGEHNKLNDWQGEFRFGHFDMEMTNFALKVCPVDSLAVTCLDHVSLPWKYWTGGEYKSENKSITGTIERETGIPVVITSEGPTFKDKRHNV